ncbi:CDP-alcohol phosphatidyltransferase [Niastella koreensis]|uniref:CDP-alcohol phosphatidyltransferase n=2 Tax=Niastella koreensis TaxID=354356 RepID=G8TH94_NIAKG|nr:CDP-alcohol phosphatidyltransferase family protein [Niastella koreensis]AEW01704.1 CDP-alcohol phosphatidyltransferase [Niastella koreensis GR20-10]OQP48414.1 CDP-alcohol phosphatidyltransferase [Niastella koreensis]
MKHIPNLFTLLNLFFGCIAIIYILQNGIIIVTNDDGAQWLEIPEKIWLGSLFIGLAAVVDFLDGFVARLFNASSALGKQLDSLADCVSFGVAPGMIIYQFLRLSYAGSPDAIEMPFIALLPALLIPCAAAFRLGKFNIDDSQQFGFKGVPTPAAGLLIASFPLIYFYLHDNATAVHLMLNPWLWYGVIMVVSLLMVSNLPLMALKFKNFSVKSNLPKLILLVAAIIAGILFKWMAVPVVFILYIILSLAFKNKATT